MILLWLIIQDCKNQDQNFQFCAGLRKSLTGNFFQGSKLPSYYIAEFWTHQTIMINLKILMIVSLRLPAVLLKLHVLIGLFVSFLINYYDIVVLRGKCSYKMQSVYQIQIFELH